MSQEVYFFIFWRDVNYLEFCIIVKGLFKLIFVDVDELMLPLDSL